MGELLDIALVILYLAAVTPRVIIVARFLGLQLPPKPLWLASAWGLVATMAATLVLGLALIPVLVGASYQMAGAFSRQWVQGAGIMLGLFAAAQVPGHLLERRLLTKGGIEADIARRLAVGSALYFSVASGLLAISMYLVAMRFF